MPSVNLDDRAIIDVSGADAEAFLQNIVTCDLTQLGPGEARPCALLTPQGKILFDFLVSRHDRDTLLLDCRSDVADALVQRLKLYRLRAKIDISKRDQTTVAVSWKNDSIASDIDSIGYRDLRFPTALGVTRHHGAREATTDVAEWTALRIENGIAESSSDYALGEAFPHDVLLDELDGVGFRKGCYVGQEVVSRMQHRGTARRRVLIVHGDRELPASSTTVSADGRALGELGSTAGSKGLAIIRIDRVKEAMDAGIELLAGGVPVKVTIPPFAKFTYPAQTEGEA